MFAARLPGSLLAGLVATAAALAVVAGGVAARGVGTPPPEGLAPVASVDRVTTTSSSTTTTPPTTTTTTPPTTSTTAPKPVATTVRTTLVPRPTVPPAPPAPAVSPPTTALPWGNSAEQRCASALLWVSGQGLNLPAGWGYRCPSPAVINGAPKWGLACWNCAGDLQSYIAVDVGRIGSSDAALRYVVAHEVCHAIDYMTLGASTEVGADLCAATHGAPRPWSVPAG